MHSRLHRIGFGLFLITAFSVGLAAVLVIVGLAMVYTKRLMSTRVQAAVRLCAIFHFCHPRSWWCWAWEYASAIGSVHYAQDLLSSGQTGSVCDRSFARDYSLECATPPTPTTSSQYPQS